METGKNLNCGQNEKPFWKSFEMALNPFGAEKGNVPESKIYNCLQVLGHTAHGVGLLTHFDIFDIDLQHGMQVRYKSVVFTIEDDLNKCQSMNVCFMLYHQ